MLLNVYLFSLISFVFLIQFFLPENNLLYIFSKIHLYLFALFLEKKGSLFDNPKMEFITYRWVWHSPCFKLPNQRHKFVLISWMMNEFITSEAKCFQSYKCNTNHFLNWKKQAFIFFLDLEKAELVAFLFSNCTKTLYRLHFSPTSIFLPIGSIFSKNS